MLDFFQKLPYNALGNKPKRTINTYNIMNKTEWKSVIVDASYVESYSPKCNRIDISGGSSMNVRIWLYIPAKLCRYNGYGQCKISYLPHFDYAEKLEEFVRWLTERAYELEICDKIRAAISESLDENADNYDEEFDRLYWHEWYFEREEVAQKARNEANTENATLKDLDAAVSATVRKFDSEFIAKLSGNTANERVEAPEKCVWRPAVDPDKEEIVKHVPAPLEPVEIEADPELVR